MRCALALLLFAGVALSAASAQDADEASGRVPGAADAMLNAVSPPRGFLPMPVTTPPRVPQQEAPGVVVTAPPVVGDAEEERAAPAEGEAALETPVSIPQPLLTAANNVAKPLNLSHYAWGAYQRGLYATAFTVALRGAAEDDPAAAALIGRLYEEALGVELDYEKAAGWYAVAAELGSAEAQTRLAAMFLNGRGVPEDPERAAATFAAAAEAGSVNAAHSLALMMLKGAGGTADAAKALAYMRQAAEGGDPDAQYALARMYEEGRGTVPDDAAATQWYGRAAASGDPAGALAYGMRLFAGVGIEADEVAAVPYIAAAARDRVPVAMNRYARLLADGQGVEADEVEAVKWHLIARAAGFSDLYLDGFMGTRSQEVVDEARERAADFLTR